MNIRDTGSPGFDLKPLLAPFSLVDDHRYSWLKNIFLQYFEDYFLSLNIKKTITLKVNK